jgi:hypothetical protein
VMTTSTMKKLAMALGVSVSEIFFI